MRCQHTTNPTQECLLKRSAWGILTAVFFFGVAGLALGFLAPGILGLAGEASLGSDLAHSKSPLTFDAPAWTVARIKSGISDTSNAVKRSGASYEGEVLTLNNWSYTAIVRGRPQPSTQF